MSSTTNVSFLGKDVGCHAGPERDRARRYPKKEQKISDIQHCENTFGVHSNVIECVSNDLEECNSVMVLSPTVVSTSQLQLLSRGLNLTPSFIGHQ